LAPSLLYFCSLYPSPPTLKICRLSVPLRAFGPRDATRYTVYQSPALVFTRRSRAPGRSRRILLPRDGACRGREGAGLPLLRLLPGGPVVSQEADRSRAATVSPRRPGGGERSPRSRLCGTGERTVESTRPREPATTASRRPAERRRRHRHEEIRTAGAERKGSGKDLHHADEIRINERRLDAPDRTAGMYSEG